MRALRRPARLSLFADGKSGMRLGENHPKAYVVVARGKDGVWGEDCPDAIILRRSHRFIHPAVS